MASRLGSVRRDNSWRHKIGFEGNVQEVCSPQCYRFAEHDVDDNWFPSRTTTPKRTLLAPPIPPLRQLRESGRLPFHSLECPTGRGDFWQA